MSDQPDFMSIFLWIFHLQKSLEIFDKDSADKIWSKTDKEIKPSPLMPIRVKGLDYLGVIHRVIWNFHLFAIHKSLCQITGPQDLNLLFILKMEQNWKYPSFQGCISFFCTIVRPEYQRPVIRWKKSKWPRLWLWKKGLVRWQQFRGQVFSRPHLFVIPSYRCAI